MESPHDVLIIDQLLSEGIEIDKIIRMIIRSMDEFSISCEGPIILLIRNLIAPTYHIIESGDKRGVMLYVQLAYPKEIAEKAINSLEQLDENPSSEEMINATISPILLYIIGGLATIDDESIIPWDIIDVISNNIELKKMLGIRSSLLTIHLSCVSRFITLDCSYEFVLGYEAAASIIDKEFSIKIKIRSEYYDISTKGSRYLSRSGKRYSMLLSNGFIIYFSTIDFIKGFVMVCKWLSLPHNNYWKELRDYRGNEEGTPISISC